MQVRPEDLAVDARRCVQEMVMVVPVDAEKNEAQDVRAKRRRQRLQRMPVVSVWHLELEHHDGDQDRDDSIAERLESPFGHFRDEYYVGIRARVRVRCFGCERLFPPPATATERSRWSPSRWP